MKQLSINKKYNPVVRLLLMLCVVTGYLVSCDDNISGDAYFTSEGDTVASYCEKDPDLSVFYRIMQESGSRSLLSVYGHFTCFPPTDAAFELYFKEYNISYDDLTKEDKQEIIYNHTIKSDITEYTQEDLRSQRGAIPTPNMLDRFLTVSFKADSIIVNKKSYVLRSSKEEDNEEEVHNGVVHVVDHVIVPSKDFMHLVVEQQADLKIFSEALNLTQLGDSMLLSYDPNYEDPHPGVDYVDATGYPAKPIHVNKLCYTIFAETDKVFNDAGIYTVNDLIEKIAKVYYGSEDLNDYTSRKNPLNKFISYHLMNRQMTTNTFIYQGANTSEYAMDQRYEYYETMLDKRIMEFKAGNQINTLKDGTFVGIDDELYDIEAMNGYIHGLNKILVYDEKNMINDVLNKRIRFDAYAIPPQLTNNNVRWNTIGTSYTITSELCGEYFKLNPAAENILWGSESWDAHQADEMKIKGWYDFTLRLLPVPPGTYEIRFGYNAVDWRGIAQLFIDGEICGIPVDLSRNGSHPDVGWVSDSQTTDSGAENDKMMRNRGYMKSGQAIRNAGWGHTLRQSQNDLRVIVGQFTFQEYDYHYFRAKNVEDPNREFSLDYLEYVPVSYIDREGVD